MYVCVCMCVCGCVHRGLAAGLMAHLRIRSQAKRDIEVKKQELGQARIERQHLEEYEVSRSKANVSTKS